MLEPAKGHVVQHQFADYRLATALDMPEIKPILVESNEPRGPFGAKGCSETALVPVGAAVANAVYDAVGVRMTALPIRPAALLRARREKEGGG